MTDLPTPEELRGLLDAATDGPWRIESDPCHFDTLSDVTGGDVQKMYNRDVHRLHASIGGHAQVMEQESNTALIALAPTLAREYLALLDAHKALEERADAMAEALTVLVAKKYSTLTDVRSAHHNRVADVSGWMREDDRDFRADLTNAFDDAHAALTAYKEGRDD